MESRSFAFSDSVALSQELERHPVEDSRHLLIQCFCETTDENELKDLQAFFRSRFPLAVLIGATSDGVISDGAIYVKDKHSVIFTAFEKTVIRSAHIYYSQNYHSNYESGKELALSLLTPQSKVLITFADGIHTNGDEYLRGINEISKDVAIAGGLAGDGGEIEKTYVFTKDALIMRGAVGISLEGEGLHVVRDFGFDWIPIGRKLKVTKALRNRVYEIEGIAAADIYTKYLGKEVGNRLPQIGIEFPLIVQKDGQHMGRAVLEKFDDGSLAFAGNVEEGQDVRFGIGDIDLILRASEYRLQRLIAQTTQKIESVFVYSCMARRRFLNVNAVKEIAAYSRCAPTAGFFTYGEFFSDANGAKLYNESITVLALSESNEPVCEGEDETYGKSSDDVETLHAIAHLSNAVSEELEALNAQLEERVEAVSQEIYRQAYYDKLTRLPNRLMLLTDMSEHRGEMLLLINIDDFTMINDFYGHFVGDLVLQELASILKMIAQTENAVLYRLHADEFGLILPPLRNSEAFELCVQRILAYVSNFKLMYEATPLQISVTVSAAKIREDNLGYANAGMALKYARRVHKNFVLFDEGLHLNSQYESNLKITRAIRSAIKENRIIPYFQPIVETASGKILKYEVLARIVDESGLLMPNTFLPLAKKLKLYPNITYIILEKCFQRIRDTDVALSINLDIDDILNDQMREFIYEKLASEKISRRMTFEIVETQHLQNEGVVSAFIKRVRALGACIAIDDFGSGFANFEYLTKIIPDFLKIDGTLVKNIDKDPNALIMVETIVSFAKKLGIKTVAEFVHSKEIHDIVGLLEMDFSQGYYFGKPQVIPLMRDGG